MSRIAVAARAAVTWVALLGTGVVAAATIDHHRVRITCTSGGFTRTESLRVLVEETGDLDSWSSWTTLLDQNIELESCSARVVGANGEVVANVPRRKHRTIESIGSGLYDSSRLLEIPFPPLEIGQRIDVEVVTHHRPVWPGTAVVLQEPDPQHRLEVEVACSADLLRWHLTGTDEIYQLTFDEGLLELQADDIPGWDRLVNSPDTVLGIPTLRLSWGEAGAWQAVGVWYDSLRRSTASSQASRLATEHCAGIDDSRECLERLARFVSHDIRYEAVEIGPGGWIPTPPDEVIARGWGDCKDKSLLLEALLEASGIPAHLVLIRLGDGRAPNPEFPWPFWFNHCIVAVDADAADARGDDPVVEGMLLVDSTDPEGGATWLDVACRDRPALLVDGKASRLIRVPPVSEHEAVVLTVNGVLDVSGVFRGNAELRLDGSAAATWARYLRTHPADRGEEVVTARLARMLPGTTLTAPEYHDAGNGRPSVRLIAQVEADHVVTGRTGNSRLRLPTMVATPEPRLLETRTIPVVLSPGLHLSRWQIALPPGWCPPVERSETVENPVGKARVEIRFVDGTLQVVSLQQIGTTQVDPEGFDALRELAVFASRTARRSIRLRCEEPSG